MSELLVHAFDDKLDAAVLSSSIVGLVVGEWFGLTHAERNESGRVDPTGDHPFADCIHSGLSLIHI